MARRRTARILVKAAWFAPCNHALGMNGEPSLAGVRWREIASAREVPADTCRWDHLLDGVWSVVRRRTDAGSIEYLAVRNRSAAARRLSAFERRLIELAVTGEFNVAIARQLRVHESTVSRTLSRTLRKLGLATRADLILLHAVLANAP